MAIFKSKKKTMKRNNKTKTKNKRNVGRIMKGGVGELANAAAKVRAQIAAVQAFSPAPNVPNLDTKLSNLPSRQVRDNMGTQRTVYKTTNTGEEFTLRTNTQGRTIYEQHTNPRKPKYGSNIPPPPKKIERLPRRPNKK